MKVQLVHISQISHKHIATPNEVLTSGETVKAKVLSVDGENHRLALSIKALQDKPVAEPKEEKHHSQKNDSNNFPDEETGFTLGDIIGDDLKK